MARRRAKRKGFVLAEATVACLIAAIFISAGFSALFLSCALAQNCDNTIKLERLKREVLAELSAGNRASGVKGWKITEENGLTLKGRVTAEGFRGKRGIAVVWPAAR